VKTVTFQLHLHLREKGRSQQELNLASRAGAEAITCCGWRETHERGVLGDSVHCRRGKIQFAECSPSNAAKLCVDGLALGDEFAMNNAADVEKHYEHGFR
jgi:hypothetical protein